MRHWFLLSCLFSLFIGLSASTFRINIPKIRLVESRDKFTIRYEHGLLPLCSTERYVLLVLLPSHEEYVAIENSADAIRISLLLRIDIAKLPMIAITNPDRYDQLFGLPRFGIRSQNNLNFLYN